MIDIEQLEDRFRISHFGKDGNVKFKEIPIPRSEKYKWENAGSERQDPFFKSWDNKPVKKTRAFWLNRYRTEEFFLALGEEYMKEVYEFNNPDIWFCDIEVEVEDEFPESDLRRRVKWRPFASHSHGNQDSRDWTLSNCDCDWKNN
jgi:hypothetical protein